MAAVGRVTFSSGESSFKSLAFIRGGTISRKRRAGLLSLVYDRMAGV
jgi:hypothetical protein